MFNLLMGLIAIAVVVMVFLYLFPVVKICGDSMHPTLKNGEYYLGRRVFRKSKCKVGRIYVFKPPYEEDRGERFVIKRLYGIDYPKGGTPKCYFLGDNTEESYDSRHYGFVSCKDIVAVIKDVDRKKVTK